MDIIQIVAIAVSGVIFVIIIELIRRNRLKERYSLIWLAASVILIVFSIWRGLLHSLALAIGVYYPPSFLFLVAIFFLLLLLLHFSVILSSLSEHNKRLAQEVGILKERLGGRDSNDSLDTTREKRMPPSGEDNKNTAP